MLKGAQRRLLTRAAQKPAYLAALLFLTLADLNAAGAKRIQFQRGHTSAEVKGRFTPSVTENRFVARAFKGQHMKIEVKPLAPNLITAGTVTSPSGKSDGAPGGVIFDSDLTETGDYQIIIFERQQNLPGTFAVRVEIQ